MTDFVHLSFMGRIAFAGIMGRRFTTLPPLIMAVATLALAVPALAQDNAAAPAPSLPRPSSPAPPASTQRQGPELNVFRDVPGTATFAPPSVTITTPPPVIAPVPVPRREGQPVPAPARPERAPERTSPPVERESVAPSPPPAPAPVETPQPADNATAQQTTPVARPAPDAPRAEPAGENGDAVPWEWIGGAAGALLLIGVVLLFLRRRPADEDVDDYGEATGEPEPAPPPPPTAAAPPRLPDSAPQAAVKRAWIDIDMTIDSASYSVLGVSIGYRLTLRNRGGSVASDMLVHALIGQADANQNDLLRAFFVGAKGMPVHSVVEIAPGESQVLTNILRLEPGAIEPLELDGRLLLVPLIAFDVHYRLDADGTHSGRSGSAFIVGQEQTPPVEKLAPFRFDQGPRQYSAVGYRRTALSLAS